MNLERAKKWIRKAENDIKVAVDELNTENPVTDAICFHAQQAVEKLLKAFLIFHNKPFRKTHDIAELISLCSKIDRDFEELMDEKIVKLTIYAVDVRYPEAIDYEPSLREAEEAIEIAEKVRKFVLSKLEEAKEK